MLPNCSHFVTNQQKTKGKCGRYHEKNTLMRSTMGIYFNVMYTKRA